MRTNLFEEKSILKIFLHMAPPVMLAQLIQALYNIVDSFFVGSYSPEGLTALSVIFPLQLVVTALAVGTGVGVNTLMARLDAEGRREEANRVAGVGTLLAFLAWGVFAAVSVLVMRPFAEISSDSALAADYAVTYGNIVCVGSLGMFLESVWTKVHQARGHMRRPMIAQIVGAVVNIVLDPILIFGLGPIPAMGVQGAAIATVVGQAAAAAITLVGGALPIRLGGFWRTAGRIYRLGYPYMVMNSLYTVYILALNMILATFCDQAVTVLGLYYKLQTFFFIPLNAFHTCLVPLLSYTYAKQNYPRCHRIMKVAVGFSLVLMLIGVFCFEVIPLPLLSLFSSDPEVFRIGEGAFRIIGLSFLPIVFSLSAPIFFQAIGHSVKSSFLSVLRQILCLIPLFFLFSRIGLAYAWLAFPVSECIVGTVGTVMYAITLRKWKKKSARLTPTEENG